MLWAYLPPNFKKKVCAFFKTAKRVVKFDHSIEHLTNILLMCNEATNFWRALSASQARIRARQAGEGTWGESR